MAYEGAFAIEDSNHGDIDDKDLAGLPVDSVSRLRLNSASNTQTVVDGKRLVGRESLITVPGVEEGDASGEIKPNLKPETRKPPPENAMRSPPVTGSPGEPQVKLDQFFEKMLAAFIKIVRPSVPKFSEIHSSTRSLKQHLKWKWTKRRFMMFQRSLNFC